jgi:hypothetical protein
MNTCDWKAVGEYFWSDKTVNEWQASVENDRILHYPKDRNNSLKLLDKIDIHSCIQFEYWAAGNRNLVLNLQLKSSSYDLPDTILSIKPNLNDIRVQKTVICIKNFVAMKEGNFSLSFNLDSNDYSDLVNGFALKTYPPKDDNKEWTILSESQSFLHKWQENLVQIKDEWNSFIPNENYFRFPATKKLTFYGNKI